MEWRLRRLMDMGFECAIWNWTNHDLRMLEKPGATFSSITGYVRGRLTDDSGTVCMEAFASGDVETALGAFRTAFTV